MSAMIRRLALALAACLPVAAGAENLAQVYQDARGYDAQYAAARETMRAGLERESQGLSLLLPSLNLTANATEQRLDSQSDNTALVPSYTRPISSYGYTLTFTQPLYRHQNWLQYDQGQLQAKQAELTYGQLVRASKAAIAEQLAQAKRNFEVGTATITDTHEAKARYDLAVSQEISAQNDLEAKSRALQLITGKEYVALKSLRPEVKLSPPVPNDMQTWVNLAQKQSYAVLIQEATTEVAQLEAKRNTAGHEPTLDLVASHNYISQNASTLSAIGNNVTTDSVSLQFSLPLYQGGGISSREREAAYNLEKARQDLENARRASALVARQAYLSVINGIAQVSALEQALVSSESALQSNRLGYEVGVRINIDVLNAQQQVFSTKRDLAVARYNTITTLLKLKAAAGGLREEDLEEINRVLEQ
jgi:outer membrane protein